MRLRKRTVDKVIKDAFWEGFQGGLSEHSTGLEYSSTSGLYAYNGVRRIALHAGYELAAQLLSEHLERVTARERGERPLAMPFEYKIPGSVYAECYGEAQLAVAA